MFCYELAKALLSSGCQEAVCLSTVSLLSERADFEAVFVVTGGQPAGFAISFQASFHLEFQFKLSTDATFQQVHSADIICVKCFTAPSMDLVIVMCWLMLFWFEFPAIRDARTPIIHDKIFIIFFALFLGSLSLITGNDLVNTYQTEKAAPDS